MRRRAALVFVASVLFYAAFFWVFADKIPGRVLWLAGVFLGAIAIAALIAVFYPHGKDGDK